MIRLSQSVVDMLDDNNANRMKVRLQFERRRRAGQGAQAAMEAVQKAEAAGTCMSARSLPSGPAPTPGTVALLALSGLGLSVAALGYVGIAALRVGWDFITGRRSS